MFSNIWRFLTSPVLKAPHQRPAGYHYPITIIIVILSVVLLKYFFPDFGKE